MTSRSEQALQDILWLTRRTMSPQEFIERVGDIVRTATKPKGKKTTFFSALRNVLHIGSLPIDELAMAHKFWEANPGSILEIVVRKPVK